MTNELSDIDKQGIDMVKSSDELMNKNFTDYACIYIGGGNTYKLLNNLKVSGAFDKIKKYLFDENGIGLVDNTGFDMLNGYSLLCHYTSRELERTELSKKYLLELSKVKPVYAIPEEDTIFVNDGKIEFIGSRPYYEFKDGIEVKIEIL